jgi:hypothetical protein
MSANTESARALADDSLGHVHAIDARATRTVADAMLEALERLSLTLRLDLHAAVGRVANPAVNALAGRRLLCEEPETHSLNAAVDHVPSCDTHTVNIGPHGGPKGPHYTRNVAQAFRPAGAGRT